MAGITKLIIVLSAAIYGCFSIAQDESCEDSQIYTNNHVEKHFLWNRWSDLNQNMWYNMSFWGGHYQIPSKDDVDNHCFASYVSGVFVLMEKHPDISTISDGVVTLDACSLNRNGDCDWTVKWSIRKCFGDLLYSKPLIDPSDDIDATYVCFDKIHSNTCSDRTFTYTSGFADDDVITLRQGDIEHGWFNGFTAGKQYMLPSLEDLETVLDECQNLQNVLQDPVPYTITETPSRLTFCKVTFFGAGDGKGYSIDYDDEGNCNNFLYVRNCSGQLQFDISFLKYVWNNGICFIYKSNVVVEPEVKHEERYVSINGVERTEYIPILQYRCNFDMADDKLYYTNWYINGTLRLQKGPSAVSEDLALTEDYLDDQSFWYKVECGVHPLIGNHSEVLSNVFYAGWKVEPRSISLRKSGIAIVHLEQTIPYGCRYFDNENPRCSEQLNLEYPLCNQDVCAGRIGIQDAENTSKSCIEVKSMAKGELWTGARNYVAKLYTIDKDYDDRTEYDLEMSVTHRVRQEHRTMRLGFIHVLVTDINRHKNKRCYSHVDPHHKTSDGHTIDMFRLRYLEMHREGDHMLYLNDAFQTEIQQSARYCSPKSTRGPVCACGIAIRVGTDAFVINQCPDRGFKFDFIQCVDGGTIDIERIHDYRYMIRTPIGTVVEINLYSWSNTMNIDIYMSAKDYGNVVGVCGYFDGDKSNDLLHRDRKTVSYDSNRSYKFSDSWKLNHEENMFENEGPFLDPWKGVIQGQLCSRPNSITKRKCVVPRTKSCSSSNRQKREQDPSSSLRIKRSEVNFTEDEAFQICNQSIYLTTAVVEFPDKLAEEDPNEVVKQCVLDLVQSKEPAWIEAHTTALNNAVDTIFRLNPVYVANHTEAVNAFRSQTCLNNCSQNGVCTLKGLCECFGTYRGPDCSIDVKIPPTVYEVLGGDICHTGDNDDCSCFQVRTNSIFDGFMCDMVKYLVSFNGTRWRQSRTTFRGDYTDIFTGSCCDPVNREKRSSDDKDPVITMYIFNISNDGIHYGEPNTVFTYDTTCTEQAEINGDFKFSLKTNYCFIAGRCVEEGDKSLTSGNCDLCDPRLDPYNLTEGHCEESESNGLTTAAIIGITTGSFLALVVIVILLYQQWVKWTKNQRSIHDSHADLRNENQHRHRPACFKNDGKLGHDFTFRDNVKNTRQLATIPGIQNSTLTNIAEYTLKRSLCTSVESFQNNESARTETDRPFPIIKATIEPSQDVETPDDSLDIDEVIDTDSYGSDSDFSNDEGSSNRVNSCITRISVISIHSHDGDM